MKRLVARWAVLFLALLPASSALAAPGAQTGSLTLDLEAGYDGYYQQGEWVPLRVLVGNTGPDIEGTLRVVRDTSYENVTFTRHVELPSNSRKEIFLYFAPGTDYFSTLDVDLLVGSRILATSSVDLRQVSPADMLYGVLGDNPSAFSELGLVTPINGNAQVAVLGLEDLPPVAEVWRALDVIVFSDVDTGQLSAAQREAMLAWVTSGGRLIVTGGPGWQRTAAGLDALLPVDVSGSVMVNDLSGLSEVAGVSIGQFQGETVVSVAQPRAGSQVAALQDDLPIWVWRDVGLGRVDFLAADPALEPLKSWADIDSLWRAMLSEQTIAPSWSQGFGTDLYYAREAVAAVPGVSLPSALQLCGFLTLYTMIVGPLNYIVLKRMKRTELAWATIPAVVFFFSACAYVTGFQLRGSKAIVHRLALVQVWPTSDVARVDGLVGLWSPRRATYDVQIGSNFLAQPLPDGYYYGGFAPATSDHTIEQGQGSVLRHVRVDVGAVQPFMMEGYAPAPHVESDLALTLDSGGGLRVRGQVRNTAGFNLENAVLLAAGSAQQLGHLPDGDQAVVDVSLLSGYAMAAPMGGIQPVPSGVPSYSSAYYPGYDTTVDDIMGTSYCYGDIETERRCNMLYAAIQPYGGGSGGRGPGVYLVGWSDEAPLEVDVLEAYSEKTDTVVYFFALPVEVERIGQTVTIPPSLMTWQPVGDETDYYDYTPYDLYLSPGIPDPISFRYEPVSAVALESVTGLTIHLNGYPGYNDPPPNVELWNWEKDEWQTVSVDWGDTSLQDPTPYAGPTGAVQLRIWPPSNYAGVSLERVDVTLEGVPSS